MATPLPNDPVLARFRRALGELYGPRLDRVVLFGSRARGDARPGSDYDLAVFLRDMTDRGAELYRLADLSTGLSGETGEFVHAMPFRAGAYDERTPLMREIRLEGTNSDAGDRVLLRQGRALAGRSGCDVGLQLHEAAGRAAYLAGFNAAQGIISERTGRSAKTHRGVQTELHRLTKDDARFDQELRAFLGRAYNLKAIADYETGPGADVPADLAADAVAASKRFVARMRALTEDDPAV